MIKIRSYYLALLFLLYACQQKQEAEEALSAEEKQVQELEGAVMAVHDLAMEKLEPLMAHKSTLKQNIEELKTDPDQVDEVILQELLLKQLEEAQKNMMDWMRRHGANKDISDPEKRITALQQEKVDIQEIEGQMTQAIQAAEAALKSP